MRDSAGNLNGAHPSSHADPSLHALVAAGSRQRLERGVALLLEVLRPTNGGLKDVAVVPGGSVVLEPTEGGGAGASTAAVSPAADARWAGDGGRRVLCRPPLAGWPAALRFIAASAG